MPLITQSKEKSAYFPTMVQTSTATLSLKCVYEHTELSLWAGCHG